MIQARKFIELALIIGWFILASACDPNRLRKCEWYLEPELQHRNLVRPGWVSLCARNFVTKKQRCFLKGKVNFVKKIYGKPFKFSSMELDESTYPREIKSITLCTPD